MWGPSAAARLEGDFGGRSAQVELRPPKKSAQVELRAFEKFLLRMWSPVRLPGEIQHCDVRFREFGR